MKKKCKQCGAMSGCKHEQLRAAYRLVMADLKSNLQCKDRDYTVGCWSCGIRLVYKTLKSFYEIENEWESKKI